MPADIARAVETEDEPDEDDTDELPEVSEPVETPEEETPTVREETAPTVEPPSARVAIVAPRTTSPGLEAHALYMEKRRAKTDAAIAQTNERLLFARRGVIPNE